MNQTYFPTIFNIGPTKPQLEDEEHSVFLTERDWDLLLEKAETRLYQPGDVIVKKGDLPRSMYLISEGQVRVEQQLGRTLATHGAGAVFGEMSFLQGRGASASVIAEGSVTVKVMRNTYVNGLLISIPGLAIRFYQSLAVTLAKRLHIASVLLSQTD
ncbi:MAG: cyclic nucleotide-binding domain-containing protein [Chloroflexi bacterium]|nr:cyclic nucleotide-binding domain-containing protein [Chloroflexota bacterium]